jgi:hypothetical protein
MRRVGKIRGPSKYILYAVVDIKLRGSIRDVEKLRRDVPFPEGSHSLSSSDGSHRGDNAVIRWSRYRACLAPVMYL